MPILRLSACALAALTLSAAALGHEFWVQPSTFRPSPGEQVKVELRVGDDLPGEPFPRKGTAIDKFQDLDPSGKSQDIAGREAQSPAGSLRPMTTGLHILGYRSRPSSVEMEAVKFERYLGDKGLDKVIAARAAAAKSAEPGREMYSRCAKSIITVGDGGSHRGFDHALGYTLEIIPENDPTTLRPDEPLRVKLLYKSAPCAGAKVLVKNITDGKTVLTARTDSEGRAALALAAPGQWMIAAINMEPAPKDSEVNSIKPDWESLWASLTFQTPDWPAQAQPQAPGSEKPQ